jgi:hypothetical protein
MDPTLPQPYLLNNQSLPARPICAILPAGLGNVGGSGPKRPYYDVRMHKPRRLRQKPGLPAAQPRGDYLWLLWSWQTILEAAGWQPRS